MTKNIDLINKVFLGICLTNWILFFTFIWDVNNYWLGALWFLLSIGLTFPYVATTKNAIKVMTEEDLNSSLNTLTNLWIGRSATR